MREHISGKDATYMAIESDKRGPVQLQPWPAGAQVNSREAPGTHPPDPLKPPLCAPLDGGRVTGSHPG